jgi:hypothetical protein
MRQVALFALFALVALTVAGCDCNSARPGSAAGAMCGLDGPTFCGKAANDSSPACIAASAPNGTVVTGVVEVADAGALDGGEEDDDGGGPPDGGADDDDGGMP